MLQDTRDSTKDPKNLVTKELFIFSKCKTKAAYSTRLRKQQYKLDLKKLAAVKEFELIMETPVVLVLKVDGVELTVHNYGEILFRNCEDSDKLIAIAEKIYECALVEKKR